MFESRIADPARAADVLHRANGAGGLFSSNGSHPMEQAWQVFWGCNYEYEQAIQAALNHPDYSEAKRQADAAGLRAERQAWRDNRLAELTAATHKQWKALRDKVAELETSAYDHDPFDPARLSLAKDSIPSTLTRFRSLGEFKQFYETTKDGYLRRALQQFGPAEISRRFGKEVQLTSFLNRLQEDLTVSFTTPELSAAREAFAHFDRHVAPKAVNAVANLRGGMFAGNDELNKMCAEMRPPQVLNSEATTEQPIF